MFRCLFPLALLTACAGANPEAPPSEAPPTAAPAVEPTPEPTPEPAVEPAVDPSTVSPNSLWDGVVSGDGTTRDRALATDARVGLHDGYDRVVIEFDKGVPAHDLSFVETVRQAGSGRPVDIAGEATFLITLKNASGFNMDKGEATVDRTVDVSALSNVAQLQIVDDYEGQLRYGIGLKSRTDPTVDTLADPPRLVIDFPHP